MAKITSFTIYDSSVDYSYEDYVSYCKDNEMKPQPEDSDAYHNFLNTMCNEDYDFFMDSIREIEGNDEPCIISGELGLWDGSHEICPVVVSSLTAAIRKCNGSSIEAIEVEFDDGVINVKAHHHDGTNKFSIRRMTDKGYSAAKRSQDNGDLTSTDAIKGYWTKKYHLVA